MNVIVLSETTFELGTEMWSEVNYAGSKGYVQMSSDEFHAAQQSPHERVWVTFHSDQANPLPIKASTLDFVQEYEETVADIFTRYP